MRPKSIVLLVLALGCGLVASIGINQVMQAKKTGTEGAPADTTPIFVALTDIAIGDPLKLETIKLEEWPKDKIQSGALTKIEDVEGRRSRVKIFAGEPILEPKLLGKGETQSNATDLIPKGFRVVAVKVDSVSSASGLIQVGDRVDVMVHVLENPTKGIPATQTRTFLQNVKVFSVDDKFRRPEDDATSSAAKTILLLVTPAQAELVMFATQLGTIQLVMRSANDDENVATSGAGVKGLMAGSESPDDAAAPPSTTEGLMGLLNASKPRPVPEPVAQPIAPVEQPQVRRGHTMRVMRAERIEEVFFPDDDSLAQATDGGAPANIGPTPAASAQEVGDEGATVSDGVDDGDAE